MATGKVKWFNNAKGYGFILRDGSEEDLFAHFSSIQMDGYRTLKAGQAVEFEVAEGPKGLCAVDITSLESENSETDTEESVLETESISVSMQNIEVDTDSDQIVEDMIIEDVPEAVKEAS